MKKIILAGVTAAVCCIMLAGCGQNAKEYNNMGKEYYNDAKYEEAADNFKKAAETDKENNPEYYVNLGMAKLELGQYEEAEKAFNLALSYNSEEAAAYRGLGIVHYFSENYTQAMEDFGTLISKAGENYNETTLEALQYYAALQTYYGDSAGAIDSYTILIRKNYNAAQQYFLRGSIFTKQGMENEAVKDYEEALKTYGNNYEMYYNIYYNFMRAGYTDRAVSYLKRAIKVDGADNFLKGRTYYIIEDYENAQKYLSKAVDEGKAEAEYFLAMAYEKLGNPEEADALYSAYLKVYPADASAYNQYGMFFMNRKEYSQALQCFVSGLAIGSEEAKKELMYNEACCYEFMHDFQTAFFKFEKYLEEYPNDLAARHEYDFLSTR